ncbi:protein FAM180A-like isoform X2 [Thalassophryne amazonica]|uniref:protein FAM180A-like isoform X2 n=1 Tax=Thalassophryne amazonica TaxID=390379 RepID=UPI0014722D76|nr:protein FAM180A-like isoform X2 [Thalassophryne amazonica]
MTFWRLVVVLLYCCINTGIAQCRRKVLFPAASRIRRDVASGLNPTFHNSFDDVHLFFEILLAARFDTSGEFLVKDAELMSLRKTRKLEVICEEIIPRKLTDILRVTSELSHYHCRLDQENFERILLTMIYAAHQMVNSSTEYQRDVWAESFVTLYKVIKQDLTGITGH